MIAVGAIVLAAARALSGGAVNGDFETGDFTGWTADPCWVVAADSRRYYSGWRGKYWAWSGGKGESATGVLKSRAFRLDKDGVRLLMTGWNSLSGSGLPRKWNYVTLNLADGTELDRVYAPNTTSFVPEFLDGSKHKGEKVFVQAVDDADQATYSMLGIDEVRTEDLPATMRRPVPALPAFNPKRSLKLENMDYLLAFNRSNGALTRVRDKREGQELILEPRLGDGYKFALPIPGKEPWQTIEANWIRSRDQKPPTHWLKDGVLSLHWKGPLKNYLGETYDVSVQVVVKLTRDGPVFTLTILNDTSLRVGETYFPVVGGIQGLGTTRMQLKATEMIRPAAHLAFPSESIFRVFDNFSWLGDHGPEQYYASPGDLAEPWVGFSCPKTRRAVLFGAGASGKKHLVAHLELVPSSSGTVREDGNWPRPSELHGMLVGVELSFVDVVGGRANQTYVSSPVLLRFLRGGGPEMRKAFESWTEASP